MGGGGQALVQTWGQVSVGWGIDKIFAGWGTPIPPGKKKTLKVRGGECDLIPQARHGLGLYADLSKHQVFFTGPLERRYGDVQP